MHLGKKSKQRIKEEAEVQQQTISLSGNVQKWAVFINVRLIIGQ